MVSHRDRLVRDSPIVPVPRHRVVAAVVGVAVATLVTSCGDDAGSNEAFCQAIAENADAIVNPQLATQDDAEAHVRLYEEVGADVPLAIEAEWEVLVDTLKTSATVVPGDAASVETARQAAYAAEESAFTVFDWVSANCGLDLSGAGPVARLEPAVTASTTTTVAG